MSGTFFPRDACPSETVVEGKVSRKVLAHAEKLMLVEVAFETGAEGSAHEHPHEQATYCLEGEFDFTVDGQTRRLHPGDTVLLGGGLRHGAICVAKGRLLDVFTPRREDFLKGRQTT
jgi:quercetin dioxygenase-like cupin family protein